jgi:hypothetical protein
LHGDVIYVSNASPPIVVRYFTGHCACLSSEIDSSAMGASLTEGKVQNYSCLEVELCFQLNPDDDLVNGNIQNFKEHILIKKRQTLVKMRLLTSVP